MKKGKAYVTRGTFDSEGSRGAIPLPEPQLPPPHPSDLNPADLPRDYGMAGRVGAYEVRPLSDFIAAGMRHLEKAIGSTDPLNLVNQQLDTLLPPANRHRLAAESFSNGQLVLSLAHRSDRFAFSRSLVPKLRRALEPELGFIRVILVDRT